MDKTTEVIFKYLKDAVFGSEQHPIDLDQLPIKYLDLTTGLHYLKKSVDQNNTYINALANGKLDAKKPDEINEITKGSIKVGEQLNKFYIDMQNAEENDFAPLGNSFGNISEQFDKSVSLLKRNNNNDISEKIDQFTQFLNIMPGAVCLFVFDEFLSISCANNRFYDLIGYYNEQTAKSNAITSLQQIFSDDETLIISDRISEEIANESYDCDIDVKMDFNGVNQSYRMQCHCSDISSEYYYICAQFIPVSENNDVSANDEIIRLNEEIERLKNENARERITAIIEQVQPHFLYNALSSIRTVVKSKPEYAYDLLYDFSIYLRGKIRALMSDDMITFEEEMANIMAYLNMEQMRFGEKLKTETDIGADDFLIIPFSIQAIVEHSVRYCIYQRGSKGGTVSISSRKLKNEYIIEIADDGIGFDLDSIPEKDKEYKSLQNTINRLQNKMGAEIEINSGISLGTKITVVIPKK